ncbi:MAG: hypothetical protein K2J71_00360 [Oscillospiraceae bacterium]|nr:hypothetical protein [Oscillospiraceae bacterium]
MKKCNKLIILFCLSALTILCAGCQKEPDDSIPENTMQTEQGSIHDPETDPGADSESRSGSEMPMPTNVPFPESDMNAVNFNDGNFAFIRIPDDSTVKGELSVENLDGNFMLKFTDLSTDSGNPAESVQKIQISVGQLLNPDQLESVHKIDFDLYQPEVSANTVIYAETLCADGNIYKFENVSAGNENFCHAEFEFLLADSGKCWDSSMQNVNVTVIRSGMQDSSEFYLDNLVFYDVEGNSIPLHIQHNRSENAEITQE